MATTFASIKADVLALLNGLTATTAAAAQTAYTNAVAGTVVNLSTDWPEGLIEAAILDAEYTICAEIALNDRHPERADFEDLSAALANGATLPTSSAGSKNYLGKFSAVVDGTTGTLLQERPLAIVNMAAENEASMFPTKGNIYAIAGGKIFFDSTNNVKITGPALNKSTFTGSIRCRDTYRPAIVSGAMTYLLTKEGAWVSAFEMHSKLWAEWLGWIRSVGRQVAVPMPSQV